MVTLSSTYHILGDTVNAAHRPFPWGDFAVVMLQLAGVLVGCVVAVAVVYGGLILLTGGVTSYALRFGVRTAKIVRNILLAVIAVAPPIIVFTWTLAEGMPYDLSIPIAGMTFGACISVCAVIGTVAGRIIDDIPAQASTVEGQSNESV